MSALLRHCRIFRLAKYTALPYAVVMKRPIHTVVEAVAFIAQSQKLGVTETERADLLDVYASDPEYGATLKHTGGLRKGRIAKDDTGKSGGYRVFSFYANERNPVFLLWIIDKSKDATLTKAQEAAFKGATAKIRKECK